ncbi:MAG: prevent-host-death protein [Zetaproteobacteria bacterium CG_4_9_14_3_um_filter_53_7]|nr:MAG: prevent-host-death protein [Zetaproteobacteria bacterium CG_4_9_14_3_um_filter_53_7]
MRYSDSIKPISYLKAHTSEVIRNVAEGQAPYVITQHGEAKAVVQGVAEYEKTLETLALLKILALGEQEIAAGQTISADDVFAGAERLLQQG